MGDRPASAKITIPLISGDYPRERLFKVLDRGRANPVIWISGPGGAGKTHLLASYIKERCLEALWYSVDHGDADVASFFHYLGLAAKKYSVGPDHHLPIFKPYQERDLTGFTFRYFEELYRLMPHGSLLLLDNLHEVHESAPIYKVLLSAVSRAPKSLNIIIASRDDPPSRFVSLRTARLMTILGWQQLCFSLSEFTEAAHVLGGKKLSQGDIEKLYGELEGWIAGLVLILEQIRLSGSRLPERPRGNILEIMEFFASQIWDVAKPEVRDFLLKTAFLPYMTAEMAQDLSGAPEAVKTLSYLSSKNIFTLRFEPGPRYRYHNLFREFLIRQVHKSMNHGDIASLKKHAAALLLEKGYPEDSAELLIEERDWGGLACVIKQSASLLFSQGRLQTILDWIRRVPKPFRELYPWFLYWEATCDLSLEFEKRLGLYRKTFDLFKEQGDFTGLLLTWAGKISTYLHGQTSLEDLDDLITEFKTLETHFHSERDIYVRYQVAISMFIALTFRQPCHPEALKWERLAHENYEKVSDLNSYVAFLLTTILRRYFTGEVGMSEKVLLELQKSVLDSDHLLPNNRILFLVLLSIELWLTYNLDDCIDIAVRGLNFSEESGGTIWDGLLLGQQANVWLTRGDLDEARKCLEVYRSHIGRLPPLSISYYHQRMAWYCLAMGDLEGALANGIEGHSQAVLAGIPNNLGYALIVRAEAHLALGENREAKQILDEAWIVAQRLENQLMHFQCGLLAARLGYNNGDENAGDRHLAEAMRTGRSQRIRNWQFLPREEVLRLLVAALERDMETSYVSELIRLWDLRPTGDLVDLEAWPWPLKIYTLGKFEVLRNGEPLRFEGKVQHRPLDLLKAIIALGGREISGERIIDALWPDSYGDAGHGALESNLHRLRKLLGFRESVLLKNGRLSLDPRICWVDAWAFERACSSATPAQGKASCCEAEKAIGSYRGTFLPGDSAAAWTVPMREGLHSRYLRLVEMRGDQLEKQGLNKQAIRIYLDAMDRCPYSESLCHRLMVCYEKTGQQGEAATVFHRYSRVLRATHGIDPGPRIRLLFERLSDLRQSEAFLPSHPSGK